MEIIDSFRGSYSFLSNFFAAVVELDGYNYVTVEHAYQAAKTFDAAQRAQIASYKSPATAKQLGKKVTLRRDWEHVKEAIMLDLLRKKFCIPQLRQYLIETGNARLVEGNYWNDRYWGVCNGKGLNRLGVLLMQVRGEINRKMKCINETVVVAKTENETGRFIQFRNGLEALTVMQAAFDLIRIGDKVTCTIEIETENK